MTTATINDLFARYSDLCGAAGPQMDRDALQVDFCDWCSTRAATPLPTGAMMR